MIPYLMLQQQTGLYYFVTVFAWVIALVSLVISLFIILSTVLDPDSDPEYNRNSLHGATLAFLASIFFGIFGWVAIAGIVVILLWYIAAEIKDLVDKL